ncbi:MAG: hypothetical protein WC834_08090, partial [Eubacteriales bacterium]
PGAGVTVLGAGVGAGGTGFLAGCLHPSDKTAIRAKDKTRARKRFNIISPPFTLYHYYGENKSKSCIIDSEPLILARQKQY